MTYLNRLIMVASAAFFIASSAFAQNAGTVTNHAFALGKGAGVTGYTSLLCTSAQLAVGQSAADPICRTITGDVTLTAAGATAIGATKVTSAMLNADVFSTAHSWGGVQTFTNPIVGTQTPGDNSTKAASTAYADAIAALKANLASPTFTGTPAAPTAAVDTNTTQLATTAFVLAQAASATPLIDGTAAAGTSTRYARGDHIHPTDTTRAPLASPALTGTPTAPTAAPSTNTTQIATTAYADAIAALKVSSTRSVLTGCGLAGGGDLSADRTLRLSLTINAQVGTTYTVLDSDCGKLVSLNNASPVAVTLPQANGSTFVSGWSVDFQNKGAGTATVTPTTSTINGGASLALTQNQGMHCDSDGTNYTCVLGVGAGAGAGTVTQVVCGTGLDGGTITASGTCSLSAARRTLPTSSLCLVAGTACNQGGFGGSGTYTTPANVLWIEGWMVGGGGGGAGGTTDGGAGGNTCWNTTGAACTTPVYQAGGGAGSASAGAAGGTISGTGTCVDSAPGADGYTSPGNVAGAAGAAGASSYYGGAGRGARGNGTNNGGSATQNTGSGGGGGATTTTNFSSGAAGAWCYFRINSPAATYTYSVGAFGTAGTGTPTGGAGALGKIIIVEHYGT